MLTHSRRSVTRFGGTGVITLTAGAATMVGDGIVLTILGATLRVTGEAAGMAAATGVAGMAAVAIGDIITIGMVVLAGAGAVVEDLITPDVV